MGKPESRSIAPLYGSVVQPSSNVAVLTAACLQVLRCKCTCPQQHTWPDTYPGACMSTYTLRIATASRPPFVFANGNSTRYTGFLLDLLPTLLGYAQQAAALEFTLLPDFDVGELVDGHWTGALSCCQHGTVMPEVQPVTAHA